MNYKALNKQSFSSGKYSIVPLRKEDRYAIMKWRNEQIYHLRQYKTLTREDQDKYFETTVANMFKKEQPEQILFSYLENDICIGYGGLVHINWKDKNAEISFIMDTELEKEQFEFHWTTYLKLIKKVAFDELDLHKIFTYAYDLRPKLYSALLQSGFLKEAVLKEHYFLEDRFIDVIIHSKLKEDIILRSAGLKDVNITYAWANDKTVRTFAYNQSEISKEDHRNWFTSKIKADNCCYYILVIGNVAAGSIRFDLRQDHEDAKISYLVDPGHTGKGYGTYLLSYGLEKLLNDRPQIKSVFGYVLKENMASIKIFNKLGYKISFENDTELKFEKILK